MLKKLIMLLIIVSIGITTYFFTTTPTRFFTDSIESIKQKDISVYENLNRNKTIDVYDIKTINYIKVLEDIRIKWNYSRK